MAGAVSVTSRAWWTQGGGRHWKRGRSRILASREKKRGQAT